MDLEESTLLILIAVLIVVVLSENVLLAIRNRWYWTAGGITIFTHHQEPQGTRGNPASADDLAARMPPSKYVPFRFRQLNNDIYTFHEGSIWSGLGYVHYSPIIMRGLVRYRNDGCVEVNGVLNWVPATFTVYLIGFAIYASATSLGIVAFVAMWIGLEAWIYLVQAKRYIQVAEAAALIAKS